MIEKPRKQEEYLCLKKDGIDIDKCMVDYKVLSIRCKDLNLYRKAFRVKIRTVIKEADWQSLRTYANEFYTLAVFVRYVYGFHSCSSCVQSWQETLAYARQKKFVLEDITFDKRDRWLEYKAVQEYEKVFRTEYLTLDMGKQVDTSSFTQDSKPFLNEKDRAHFNKCFKD